MPRPGDGSSLQKPPGDLGGEPRTSAKLGVRPTAEHATGESSGRACIGNEWRSASWSAIEGRRRSKSRLMIGGNSPAGKTFT